MKNQKGYNIPATRKGKAELIKALMKGEKTIEDILEAGYKITMWREDPRDPAYLETFDGARRISKMEYEEMKITRKATFVTLDLNGRNGVTV